MFVRWHQLVEWTWFKNRFTFHGGPNTQCQAFPRWKACGFLQQVHISYLRRSLTTSLAWDTRDWTISLWSFPTSISGGVLKPTGDTEARCADPALEAAETDGAGEANIAPCADLSSSYWQSCVNTPECLAFLPGTIKQLSVGLLLNLFKPSTNKMETMQAIYFRDLPQIDVCLYPDYDVCQVSMRQAASLFDMVRDFWG